MAAVGNEHRPEEAVGAEHGGRTSVNAGGPVRIERIAQDDKAAGPQIRLDLHLVHIIFDQPRRARRGGSARDGPGRRVEPHEVVRKRRIEQRGALPFRRTARFHTSRDNHARGARIAVVDAHRPVRHVGDDGGAWQRGREHAPPHAGAAQKRAALGRRGPFEQAHDRFVRRRPQHREIVRQRFAHAPSGGRKRQFRVEFLPSFDSRLFRRHLPLPRRVDVARVHEAAEVPADVDALRRRERPVPRRRGNLRCLRRQIDLAVGDREIGRDGGEQHDRRET